MRPYDWTSVHGVLPDSFPLRLEEIPPRAVAWHTPRHGPAGLMRDWNGHGYPDRGSCPGRCFVLAGPAADIRRRPQAARAYRPAVRARGPAAGAWPGNGEAAGRILGHNDVRGSGDGCGPAADGRVLLNVLLGLPRTRAVICGVPERSLPRPRQRACRHSRWP